MPIISTPCFTPDFCELAERREAERIEGKVVRVEQDGESGHVQAIVLAERFNRETAFEYERTRDSLVLHYNATTRDDTPFWNDCRTMSVPETLRETVALFRADGRYFRTGEDFFALPSCVQVMIGQGVVPADYHPIVDAMPDGNLDQHLARIRGRSLPPLRRCPRIRPSSSAIAR